MDKGIRPACNAKFIELLPARVNSREGNVAFRKNVMGFVMEQFGATLASAATHYNHAFIDAKKLAETDATIAAQLAGLGRPEDKKGGRKPKAKPAPDAGSREAVLANMQIALGKTGGDAVETPAPAAVITDAAAAVGLEHLIAGAQTEADAPVDTTAPVLHSVRKVSDQTVVAEGLTLDEANALIAKAAQAKKAKLELVA
jgi:hypothetical protein